MENLGSMAVGGFPNLVHGNSVIMGIQRKSTRVTARFKLRKVVPDIRFDSVKLASTAKTSQSIFGWANHDQ